MAGTGIHQEVFMLDSEGLDLRVFLACPESGSEPLPSVQIHHAGGGYESIYEHMAVDLAEKGFVGVAMTHRGYPGSDGEMEYGKGESRDIGNLTEALLSRPNIDPDAMGLDQAARVFRDAYGEEPSYRGPVVVETKPLSQPKK